MSMTREDVLRELELLPLWTLRAPLPTQSIFEPMQPVLDASVEDLVIEKVGIETPQLVNQSVLITSDDKKWLFVLPAELTDQATDLFNNILRALSINKTQTYHTQQLTQDIASLDARVAIIMGEGLAQQLLASTESLESLRGIMHIVNGLQVIATYHPDDLLLHLANKAKTWDDLCMALDAIST